MIITDFYNQYHKIDPFNKKIPLENHKKSKQDLRKLCKEMYERLNGIPQKN